MPTPVTPEGRQDFDLWMIYANKIRETYFPNAEIGAKNRIYIPPLNQQAIPAGARIDAAVTNYGISKVGDGLIEPDNPLMTFGGETYAQKCLRYLQSVQLGGISSAGLKQAAANKLIDLNAKQAAYDAALTSAQTRYDNDKNKDPNASFWDWVSDNYTMLQTAKSDLNGAEMAYEAVLSQIYGPGYQSLQNDKNRVAAACNPAQSSIYNMEVSPALIGAKDVKVGPKRYAPLYTIGDGSAYPSIVDGWVDLAADRDTKYATISFNSSEFSNYSWHAVGFDQTTFNAGTSWFPFFRINYNSDNVNTSETVHVNSQSSNIKFEIKALQIQTFPIGPDNSWLPQDVKKQYPTLFKAASPDLWDPMYRIQQVVIGYNVSIKITMDKSTYDQVNEKITHAANKSGGASASLFGFLLNIGGTAAYKEENSTDFSQVTRNNNEYSFEIPANNNCFPVLLAALGTQVGGKSKAGD
jgi:hypothetical protein